MQVTVMKDERPLLLDLFCGAGGCATGYNRAGFDVVGVDCVEQPRYPFTFVKQDAMWILEVLVRGGSLCPDMFTRYRLSNFTLIHASPPCQGYSTLKHLQSGVTRSYLVPRVRELLKDSQLPFVIENVVGSPLQNPVRLCGSSFGLGVRRHRLFESNMPMHGSKCNHAAQGQPICVAGTGGRRINRRKDDRGGAVNFPKNIEQARSVMGIDWMTRKELSQSIPPAYTEFIGMQVLKQLKTEKP